MTGKSHLTHPTHAQVVLNLIESPYSHFQWLLVHGAMDRAASMSRMMKLMPNCDVLAYDRRGYGRTRVNFPPHRPQDLFVQNHVDDVLSLIARKPTLVFGHSMGGTYALLAATSHPPNLLGVVTYETPLPAEKWWPRWAATEQDLHSTPTDDEYKNRAEAFMIAMIGNERWRRLPYQTQQDRREEGFALISEMAHLKTEAGHIDYGSIEVPVLALIGSQSAERHVSAQKLLMATIPGAFGGCVLNAPHGAHLSHPKALVENLQSFQSWVLLERFVGNFTS